MKKSFIFLAVTFMGFCANPKGHSSSIKCHKQGFEVAREKIAGLNHRKPKTINPSIQDDSCSLMRSFLQFEVDCLPSVKSAGDSIALNENSEVFSNCSICLDSYHSCNSTCIETTYFASSSSASCVTPKMIIGQLTSPMPGLSHFYVKCDVPTGSCGTSLGFVDLSTSLTAQPLVKCITCPFSDYSVSITYLFYNNICLPPQEFERTFTLSIVDDVSGVCCP